MEPWPPEPSTEGADAAGPPLCVWLAVAVLVGPPTVLFGWLAFHGSCGACVVLFLLPFVWLPVPELVRGQPGGVALAGFLGLFLFGVAALVTVPELVRQRGPVSRVLVGAGVMGWSGAVVGLVWWPETRRWCEMLPEHDAED